MELEDKVVLITGSSDGIGKETAIAFSKKGSKVIITYNKNEQGAEEVAKECNAKFFHLNVLDDVSIERLVEEVKKEFGKIDVLVNNAGVIVKKFLEEHETREIDEQVETNLTGLIKMTRTFLPVINKDGVIINISSGAGKTGYAGLSVYCATKFGVRGFTQSLAGEISQKVYSVNPGITATKMTNYMGTPPKRVADIIVETAQGKLSNISGSDVDVWKYC